MASVRVRFAPSPTGFLHVGGARTAIFNWLYARKLGGTFVLRIEDTDRQRSSDEMVRAILDGMDWLGLAADEGPFLQSEARERHVRDAAALLASGQAYRCFCSADALARAREQGHDFVYPRTCRAVPREESERRAQAGVPFAVRCRVPEGTVAWDDLVHGPTAFPHDAIEDFVLLRSDGSPTYQMSVVSDDIAMRITHVIRGDDHLSNTPKQIVLYRGLGETPPTFAHLPMILGDDRKRLSKRHGAVSVLAYRELGYLPEAMLNFLALLGWAPGDDREKLSRTELVQAFDFGGVGKSGAIFDLRKLDWLNGQYLNDRSADELAALLRPRLAEKGLWRPEFDAAPRPASLLGALDLLKARARTLDDIRGPRSPVPRSRRRHSLRGRGRRKASAWRRPRGPSAGARRSVRPRRDVDRAGARGGAARDRAGTIDLRGPAHPPDAYRGHGRGGRAEPVRCARGARPRAHAPASRALDPCAAPTERRLRACRARAMIGVSPVPWGVVQW